MNRFIKSKFNRHENLKIPKSNTEQSGKLEKVEATRSVKVETMFSMPFTIS